MDIYWIKNKQRRGPAAVPDILSLVRTGELSPDTLGWHTGCTTWMPLKKLPALADYLAPVNQEQNEEQHRPAPEETKQSDNKGDQPTDEVVINIKVENTTTRVISLPRPWTRLAARLVDSSLYSALAAWVVSLLNIPFTDLIIPLFWFPIIFLEAFLLWRFGTTPGKMLMGINLSAFGTTQQLTFGKVLHRSVIVNAIGMGCYLFPICIVTMFIAYMTLKNRGITMWDALASTLPLQTRRTGAFPYISAVFIIYMMMQSTTFSLLKLPGTYELLEKTAPDSARTLREMMPELQKRQSGPAGNAPSTPQPLQ